MTHYSENWTKEDQKEADRKWHRKNLNKIREYGKKHNPKTSKRLWKEGKKFWQTHPLEYKWYMKGYYTASKREENNG